MFVKRNKNQLRDYMTTGPAHTEAARLTGPAQFDQFALQSQLNHILLYFTLRGVFFTV